MDRSLLACTLLLSGCARDIAGTGAPDATPIADTRCDADRSCTPPTPVCDATRRTCVPCLPANDACPRGQRCEPTPTGQSFQCTPGCKTDSDCQDTTPLAKCCHALCVPVADDVNNCGACDHVCPPINNGEPGCSEGQCLLCDCHVGFDDCDHDSTNCCETPTGTDPMNCGACGFVCAPYPNGIPSCSNSICSAVCAPGYADCNTQAADGCEIQIDLDINNCGACAHVCPTPPQATPTCDAPGKCTYRCHLGFGDCNASPDDGCEQDLRNDPTNCGHCHNACPPQSPTCRNATCE